MSLLEDSERDAGTPSSNTGEDWKSDATLSAPGKQPWEVAEVSAGAAAKGTFIPPSLHARFADFELLGQGGMGVVYRAHDLKLRRSVAIKLLSIAGASPGADALKEARSLARLRHEHACEVYEAGIANHVPYIVMQLIVGEPLSKAKGGMTLEEKVLCVRGVASALHEAHRLGMVHRDVKPGNILIERGEDGACEPYIVDFGLARDVSAGAPTMTAGVQGTPAFMAPEQAAGKVDLIDRRTDVYGLGATLYDILAGRPPFIGDTAVDVMRGVMEEDAPPLHLHRPGIAVDLSAIVMKCLEKDPRARYPSAKALGEDLQRFLDGDPVTARPVSRAAVLWRRARRRKGAVVLTAALLAAALLVTGLWIRGQSRAARRVELARELGESVTGMEAFLRTAYGMPLHDVERERDVVRGRLRRVEERMAEAGEIGVGPGHDALGRGLLALGEPAAALEHFREAERAGYRSPGLDYAMGLALSALYKEAIDATRRIQSEARRKAKIAEIEAAYRDPAVARLRSALIDPAAPAAYVEGLIALHEGREDAAVKSAQTAYLEAPWMHEAKKLEGDAWFAIGSRHRADKAFDYDRAKADFERAAGAYVAAAELGRSDPSVHLAECELWVQIMNAASERGAAVRPAFERARAACERAVTASPRSRAAHVMLAWTHNCFAWWVAAGRDRSEALEPVLKEAEERAAKAALWSPDDPMVHYIAGALGRTRALDALNRGRDARGAFVAAVAGYEAALRLDPDFLWALNELCSSLAMRGKAESLRGEDPSASFAAAAGRCERATAMDPSFLYPWTNRVLVTLHEAEHLLRTGRSPEEPAARGLALIDTMEKNTPTLPWIPIWRARLLVARALHAIAGGGDADKPLSEAEAELGRLAPATPAKDETMGLVLMAKARAATARGQDADEALRGAVSALKRAVEAAPSDVDDRVWLAEAHLLSSRWAARRGRPDAAALDAALEALAPLREERAAQGDPAPLQDPRVSAVMREIEAARAGLSPRDRGRGAGL